MVSTLDGPLESGYWESLKFSPIVKSSSPVRALKWLSGLFTLAVPAKQTAPRSSSAARTAYLDGLRGFAALLVYIGHHEMWAHEANGYLFENVFGWEGAYNFATLPGIRTFFSGGHFSVTIFFVLSGYVLSSKPLSLIHASENEKLGDNVASALFRRWLRLYIPLIITTFIYMTSWHALGFYSTATVPKSTWTEEVVAWFDEIKQFTYIFRNGGEPWFTYNFHAWSLPVEFKGSIVVYTSLLAFSRATRNARLVGWLVLIFYFMYIVDGAHCAMFVSGILLCDLDQLSAADNHPRFLDRFVPFKTTIFHVMLVVALYLGGVPSHTLEMRVLQTSPGWVWLSHLKPRAIYDFKAFYLFVAATLLVASVRHIKWLRAFFESAFCQYLGRISFALYLVHGPVLWTLGDRLYAAVGCARSIHTQRLAWWSNRLLLPRVGPFGLELRFFVPNLVLLPLTLWLAEVVTRFVDEPSVDVAHWIYKRAIGPRSS